MKILSYSRMGSAEIITVKEGERAVVAEVSGTTFLVHRYDSQDHYIPISDIGEIIARPPATRAVRAARQRSRGETW